MAREIYASTPAASSGPTGPAGGDLSGAYPNPGVAKINGAAVPASKTVLGSNASSQLVDNSASVVKSGDAAGGDLGGTYPTPSVQKINGNTPATIATSGKWSDLQNGTAALVLNNGANGSEFDHSSAVTFAFKNITAATVGASQLSPFIRISGTYWTGSASAEDAWTIQDVIANGANGTSFLTFTHSGSTGTAAVKARNLFVENTGSTIGIMFKGANAINGVIMQDMSTPSAPTDMILFKTNGAYQFIARSTLVYGWSSATSLDAGGMVPDTGLSRISAAVMAIGNGTQGDTTGNLQLNQITKYNAETTVGPGVGYIRGNTSQKAETGADANVLTVTPPAAAGSYRLRIVISVSAATAATIGWTATWTDSNGNAQTPANLALYQTGVAAPALTFTTSAAGNYYGDCQIDINNGAVNIVIKTTFAGTSVAYKVTATIERLA